MPAACATTGPSGRKPRAPSRLPRHQSGLGVIAPVGTLRYREHRSVPEIRHALRERGVAACGRTVTNLPDRGACPPAG